MARSAFNILVRSWVQINKRPQFNDISSYGYALKSLWSQFPCLELRDGLLVRRVENVDKDTDVIYQALVPRNIRRTILNCCHDIKTSGHLGVSKTISRVKQKFYWPGLQSDVRSYIAGCEACSKRKGPIPIKRAPMQIVRSGYPMERIAIDILGELPQTAKGNKYILVVSDYFTKWTEALPLPNIEACTVAKILVDEILCRFGIPQKIHSDQGRQFESNLFREMCKLLGIDKTRTTPYHPQSDGMVERFNRTLATMLTAYVSTNQRDWDDQLPYVMMAYRSAEHETTGMSPNMLMFGREVSTPLDLMFELLQLSKPIPNNQWVWELRDKIESAHKLVRQYTQQSMHRQKRLRDSRTSYETFSVGDQVYVYFPVKKIGTSAKLTARWRGPFQITGKLSDILYKVNCGYNRTKQVIHCDRIRLCKQQILRGETDLIDNETMADDSSSNDDFHSVNEDNMVEINDVPDVNIEQTDDSDSKRIRRKPVWAKDYVFSFRDMPNLKKTPNKYGMTGAARKMNDPSNPANIICSFCLEPIKAGETFEKHLIRCYSSRCPCTICGRTFKRESYLLKHKKNQHNSVEAETTSLKPQEKSSVVRSVFKPEASTSKESDKESDSNSEKELSDWQESPKISLGSSDRDSDDESDSDSEKVNETLSKEPVSDKDNVKVRSELPKDSGVKENPELGRMIRKPTQPQVPVAPKKPRVDNNKTEFGVKSKSEAARVLPNKNCTKVMEFTVKCSNQGNDSSSEQKTVVEEGGEVIYENKISMKRQKKDSITIRIGDLIPEGNIRTSDIEMCLSRDAQVQLQLKYRPDDD